MNLEEFQQKWQSLDTKLDRVLEVQQAVLKRTVVDPSRRRIHMFAVWPVIDGVFSMIVLLWAGSFLGDHWGEWSLVVPAGATMVAAALLLATSVHQLVRIGGIDWAGAVVDIQTALSQLRVVKIRQFKWIILLSPLVGFSVLIVIVQGLLDGFAGGVRILEKVDAAWVAANYVFGILFIPAGYALARFLAKRYAGERWWQRLLDDISGASIGRAREELASWSSLTEVE